MVSSDLYDHPALFDELFPVRGHLPHYLELARDTSGDILELACGTGQLTVPIASAGFAAAGVDNSEPMMRLARERAAEAKVSIEYVLGDMRTFDLNRRFGLIFIARNSLLHLHSTQDILAAFARVRQHLAPGGIFAFDIFNPNVRLLARPGNQRFPVMHAQTKSFGTLTVDGTNDYDSATQVSRDCLYISAGDKPDAWTLSLSLRSIFPQELPLLLAAAGFHLKSRGGEIGQTHFDSSSRLQVCICEVAA